MGVRNPVHVFLIGVAVLLCGAAFAVADDALSLNQRVRNIYSDVEHLIADSSKPAAVRADAAFRISRLEADPELLTELRLTDSAAADVFAVREVLRQYEFARARERIEPLLQSSSPAARRLHYHWLFLIDDLPTVEQLYQAQLAADSKNTTAQLARAELLLRTLQYDAAAKEFESVLVTSTNPLELADSKLGLAKIYGKQNDSQRALDTLLTTLNADMFTADIIFQIGYQLIDQSRVSEAIDMFGEALRWNPGHELAHYFLGNGYARLNYTQLEEKYPTELADKSAHARLRKAIASFAAGNAERANRQTMQVHDAYPRFVPATAFMASLHWSQGEYDEAADWFRQALAICPEYGRAHSGLARTLETKRLRLSIHRERADSILNATPLPNVPRVDEYVLNWKSLSPRHQKQVALAVEPWRLYLPLLVESGHHHYIKPLHEKLSESPGLETLVDQRIGYDSRLWDDVRGCGGYTTVTGIEDVERSIYWSYNTVLHELTHQVHGVFPPDDAQRLVDAYHVSRNLEDAGTKVFMSQYQSASVWEYFAEGANGYYSPRRDEYDTREIVRERLFELDTTLVRLVEHYVAAPNLAACYPVGLVNAADDRVERNEISQALSFSRKAYERAPQADVVLAELSYLYSLRNEDRKALAFAESLRVHYPTKAEAYSRWYYAKYFTDGNVRAGAEYLRGGISMVDSTERKTVRQALGNALWHDGDYAGAADLYQHVLAEHANDSDALWGLGLAFGDAGRYAEADSAFQKALLERSGIADLRLDYARILLMADRLADAETQVHEAELLMPGDPAVVTMQGWIAAIKGDWKQALAAYNQAVNNAPHDRLAAVLRIDALRHTGQEKKAAKEQRRLSKQREIDVPAWVYSKSRSAFATGYAWPHYLRDLLSEFKNNQVRL